MRRIEALKPKFVNIPAVSQPKRPEQILWVAVLSRAVLDVRHGTEQEALAVLGWIERDRDEFEQVVTLAGLESGHVERFERAMRAAFAGRFRRAPRIVDENRLHDSPETAA